MNTKFTVIQAFRGFAALWVVFFHLESRKTISHLTAALPDFLVFSLFRYGVAGVAIFFVLSGFVIMHSLRNVEMNSSQLGKFILRRSIRLDPPYWASIALAIAVTTLLALSHHEALTFPSVRQLLAHVFYSQELLEVPEIQIVYWTLTYEVQFYLVLALTLWLATGLGRNTGERQIWLVVMIPLYVLAIISAIFGGEWAYHGLFINLWHGFFLGVLAYEAGVRNRNPVAFFVLAAVVAIRAIYIPGVFGLPCTAMALLLFVMARAKKLDTWFFWAWLQWLGAISYSLYLVHVPILTLAGGAWQSFFGRGIVADLGSLIFQIASCLVAAALMRKIIEKPCQQLASRLFSKRRNTSAIATPPLENF